MIGIFCCFKETKGGGCIKLFRELKKGSIFMNFVLICGEREVKVFLENYLGI